MAVVFEALLMERHIAQMRYMRESDIAYGLLILGGFNEGETRG